MANTWVEAQARRLCGRLDHGQCSCPMLIEAMRAALEGAAFAILTHDAAAYVSARTMTKLANSVVALGGIGPFYQQPVTPGSAPEAAGRPASSATSTKESR